MRKFLLLIMVACICYLTANSQTIPGANFENPIDIGTMQRGGEYLSSLENINEYGDDTAHNSNDIYYKVTIPSGCNSYAYAEFNAKNAQSHLIHLNQNGKLYYSDSFYINSDTNGNTRWVYLPPGTHYLVLETATEFNSNTPGAIALLSLKITVTPPPPPTPIPEIETLFQNNVLCSNGNMYIRSKNYHNLKWYRNGIAINQNSYQIKITQPGNYQGTYTDCAGTTFSNTLQITQSTNTTPAIPSPPTIATPNGTKLCNNPNSSVTLTASGEQIRWYINGYFWTTGNTVITSSGGTYTATTSSSCGESLHSQSIIITPKETITVTLEQPNEYCATLRASRGGILQWYEERDGTNILIPGATGQTFNIDRTTWYKFKVKAYDSCGDSIFSSSQSKVYPEPPKPTITTQGETNGQCYKVGSKLSAEKIARWYLNGVEVHNGKELITSKGGAYTAKYDYTCRLSQPSNTISVYEPVYLVKKSRFDPVSQTFNAAVDTQAVKDDLNFQVSEQIRASCEGQADTWIESLALTNYMQTQRDTLRKKLIEVCQAGGDFGHPMGASSTANSEPTASGYTNFGEAIKGVLGLNAFSDTINPYLLDSPYPYGVKQQAVTKTIAASNIEICNRLAALKQQHSQAQTGGSFYQYLVNTYGSAMTMSGQELAVLEKSCDNCKYILSQDVPLPVFMNPGAKGFITQAELNTAKASLQTAFAGGSLDMAHANYPAIYANFMNHRWGFTLSYDQYREYESALLANPEAILCNKPPYGTVEANPYACVDDQLAGAVANGKREYAAFIRDEEDRFRAAYVATCSSAEINANLTARQKVYHYTLYYYDQAGNLVRTVPPEGVALLGQEEIGRVQQARENELDCQYDGPQNNAVKATALQDLSVMLSSANAGAMEMWLYNDDKTPNQMLATTTDKKFMVQACIIDSLVNVDVFKLTHTGNKSISFIQSNHATINIKTLQPLHPWTHLVIQGANLATGEMQLYVNGSQKPLVSGAPPAGCGWEVTSRGDTINMPENLSTLKHLRIYNRLMTAAEIAANARNGCFNLDPELKPALQPNLTAWHRFNVPATGSQTTIAENSTQEQLVNPVYPGHRLTTTYAYNSTNQVIKQHTPDGGTSAFWYDLLSRLAVSQNAKQKEAQKYSYTVYDSVGRITEVGEKAQATALSEPDYLTATNYQNFLTSGANSQITQTLYDAAPAAGNGIPAGLVQNNLRKRVAASIIRDTPASTAFNATYYNYDQAGNVQTLYQQVNGLGLKTIGYEYDLISGKVNFVRYQHGQPDQFYYQYGYDAENRLTDAWSAVNASVSSYGRGSRLTDPYRRLDAHYYYYLHGPLARMELGDVYGKVQGVDYAYTLQGWLKGVNSTSLDPAKDAGQDGGAGHPTIGKDVFGYSLGYYGGDYSAIGGIGATAFAQQYEAQQGSSGGQSLYNGNISNATYAINKIDNGRTTGYTYRYDQLNRLKSMRQHDLWDSNNWNNGSMTSKYAENFNYDGNGNILKLQRNNQSSQQMDNLAYNYNRANGQLINNRLQQVADAVPGDTQPGELNGTNNYNYDEIGNLVADSKEGISNIDWTVYGKIKSIVKSNGSIAYNYDATGNRVSKTAGGLTTYYIRDAQGNTLGIYDNKSNTINWREQHLYGSSRLGMWNPDVNVNTSNAAAVWDTIGKKRYELTNHLGNVIATITDKRVLNGSAYEADVVGANDYYSFGSLMPGRSWSLGDSYRYGFGGHERDNEIKGGGNHLNFGDYGYDPRIGRRWNVDPKATKMSAWSPYSFSFNNPLYFIDSDGQEPTPAEAARMAAHVYGDKKDAILTGGWRVSQRDFGIKLQDATGLKSLVYERVIGGKVTEYTYATAGTEANWSDAGADVKQPLGLSKQYSSAAFNAGEISKALGTTELTFTGHSLGGGEAALNALLTDRKAITFNAAGVGAATKFAEGTWTTPFKSESKIDAYILRTDPLNKMQDNLSPILPGVNGNRHSLWPKDLSSTYNGHSMDNMLKNFGVKKPEEYSKP